MGGDGQEGDDLTGVKVNWRSLIDAATDLEALAEIDHQLEQLGPPVRKWQMSVVLRRNALLGKVAVPKPNAPVQPVFAFAEAFGLPAPDGRRLHAYRLTNAQFGSLQQDLSRRGSYSSLEIGHSPGLFVLWASEWFRRSYAGGMRRWDDLAQALGLPTPGQTRQNMLRDVTRKGLQQWLRPVYSDSMTQYLATLAREGGFPACAVAGGAQGWAKAVLEVVVAALMGSPAAGEAEALALARQQKGRLPGIFSDDEFIQLCADLAFAIVQLRREAEPYALAANIPLAAWLGLNRPDWRQALPISTGDADADALVETLIQVDAISGSIVNVERLVQRDGEGHLWHEAVRIGLDGDISGGAMAGVDTSHGRLRAFGAGPMARHVPGELALFDPPALGDTSWSARSGRLVRGIVRLPFACPVQLDLRAGERSVARIDLPGGKPRRGQLLVAVLEEGSAEAPRVLRVIGSGSGSYREAELFLQVPREWAVLPMDQGSVAPLGSGVGDTALWRVSGGARLTDPFNDCYRILCGQAVNQTVRIDMLGNTPAWAEVNGSVDLFAGPPHIARSSAGDLVLRQIGKREWRTAPGTLPVGHYEIGLRHEGIMLDRRRVAVLQPGADVRAVYRPSRTEYELAGFGSVSITPEADAPVIATTKGDRWVQLPQAGQVYRFDACIAWPDAPPLTVSIAFPAEACIARWDGQVLLHRAVLTLDDMRDLVAIDRGAMTLLADLRDPRNRARAEMAWSFTREMPMSAVEADIASLLLPASLDAEVVLDMNNGINTNWHVRQFPLELIKEGSGFVASQAIAEEDITLCGRAIADPIKEACFGPYSLLSEANHRPVRLPDGLQGDWLVFLRHSDRVLTRPCYIRLDGHSEPVGGLGQAMVREFGPDQNSALAALIDLVSEESAEAETALGELLALAASMRGLPPVTFNVLPMLAAHPKVLARMAFRAGPAQRDAVMALALALPFAWFTIPRACWVDAKNAAGLAAMTLLRELPDAPRFAMQMVEATQKALVEQQPLLGPIFGLGDRVDLPTAAQAFVRRAIDRIPRGNGARYRSKLGDRLPGYFLRFDKAVLDALDAPCAAALAVKGEWTPSADDIRDLKLAARTFPTWFSEAFAASLLEQA
jgi:hypothetical protein